VVNATPRPLYPRARDPVPVVQEAGWAPGTIWTDAENLAPTGIFFFLYSLVLCTSSVLGSLSWLSCTNTHAAGSIRTRNPSERAATDLSLRPCGDRDRPRKISPPTGIRTPDRSGHRESQYRLSYPGRSQCKKYHSFFSNLYIPSLVITASVLTTLDNAYNALTSCLLQGHPISSRLIFKFPAVTILLSFLQSFDWWNMTLSPEFALAKKKKVRIT
jgi:hypothetical protein